MAAQTTLDAMNLPSRPVLDAAQDPAHPVSPKPRLGGVDRIGYRAARARKNDATFFGGNWGRSDLIPP